MISCTSRSDYLYPGPILTDLTLDPVDVTSLTSGQAVAVINSTQPPTVRQNFIGIGLVLTQMSNSENLQLEASPIFTRRCMPVDSVEARK